LMRWCRGE